MDNNQTQNPRPDQSAQQQISDLTRRVEMLEGQLSNGIKGESFSNFIRDIVFPDQDTSGATTSSTSIGAGGGTVTYPKLFDHYLKIYFRGKVFRIPVYLNT